MQCLIMHKINVGVMCNRRKRPRFGHLGCMATAMAVYAGIWTWICGSFGLLSWVGFAGCTSYFACGKRFVQGAICATAANVSGVIWAMLSILLAECSTWTGSGAILCAFISFAIIMQSKIRGLEFIPGAFIGCFVTFAAGGDGKMVILTLLLGILLGWMTDLTGEWMLQKVR